MKSKRDIKYSYDIKKEHINNQFKYNYGLNTYMNSRFAKVLIDIENSEKKEKTENFKNG